MIHIIKIGLKNSYTLTKKFFVQNYKTQLQQLAEGKIDFTPPKYKKTTSNKKEKEIKQKSKTSCKTGQQTLEFNETRELTTLDSFT